MSAMNNVRRFGALGDGKTKDTAAIQKAIDAGGMAYFPPGIYLSGTLYLKNNGGLELAPGAVLLASPDKEDYNIDNFCEQNRVFTTEKVSGAHLIAAVEQCNIVIRGGGRIDGNRRAFYDTVDEQYPNIYQLSEWRPGQMLFFCECENVTISDVELWNAPYWTCFLHGCEQVTIHGLRIWNDKRTPNGDGIDVDCCRFVTISDCIIESGDDCITLRGCDTALKKKRACEYITITNCMLSSKCNAFRIGVGDGLIHFCTISNIVIHHTRHAICFVSLYSAMSSGVQIEDIILSNITIEAESAIIIRNSIFAPEDTVGKPIRRISFSNIRGVVSHDSCIMGCNGNKIKDIAMTDIRLVYAPSKTQYTARMHRNFTHTEGYHVAFYMKYAENIAFNNVEFQRQTDCPTWKYGILAQNSEALEFTNCRFGKENSINERP